MGFRKERATMDAIVMSGPPSPRSSPGAATDYARVARAIEYLTAHRRDQPRLERVAAEVGLSEFHFQRMFERWAGVSPKRFAQLLTLEESKRRLRESRTLLETSLGEGLSGPSRLHDLFVRVERMTPGEYKRAGRDVVIRWGVASTPLGGAVLAATDRGLCLVSFVDDDPAARAEGILRERWPEATFERAPAAVRAYGDELRARLEGRVDQPLPIVLRGTDFQINVWEALIRVAPGQVLAYSDLARAAGEPRAVRAVASAVAANPIAYLVPCHRVIRSTGAFGQYRWGPVRKTAMLGLERARG
jgi:AraC family transcriptional regulator, regulatory protein of adaptative response / methylated-DNA-[protein]-cysteine methyltransferase